MYYTVDQAFDELKKHNITTHKESMRRWLREGKIKGEIRSRKEGWQIKKSDLDTFIKSRVPSATIEVDIQQKIDQAAEKTREEMWWELVRKHVFERIFEVKKSRLRECVKRRGHGSHIFDQCWAALHQNNAAYKNPRVFCLLGYFVFEGERVPLDHERGDFEEQVLHALIEFVRVKYVRKGVDFCEAEREWEKNHARKRV